MLHVMSWFLGKGPIPTVALCHRKLYCLAEEVVCGVDLPDVTVIFLVVVSAIPLFHDRLVTLLIHYDLYHNLEYILLYFFIDSPWLECPSSNSQARGALRVLRSPAPMLSDD